MKSKDQCKNISFDECELTILRMAVDNAQEKIGKRNIISKDIDSIIRIVENFIRKKKLICYGGTAINNIIPIADQFYNKNVEIPDYDFFSTNAMNDAKELADIYYDAGYTDVEAKAGQHHGTYKVYVNYIPVADITHIVPEIFTPLKKDSILISGILYAAPNFLRMSMFLELSRPAGDTSRWEKVLKRLALLNKHYPIKGDCRDVVFQREMENKQREHDIYKTIKDTLIHQGVVFFGGYAISLYSQYMPHHLRDKLKDYADFDVLSNEPSVTATIVKERLNDIGIRNVKIKKHEGVGEIISEHYEIVVNRDTICFIYKTIGCNSYNVITHEKQSVKIATIDTMMSFYLAFMYTSRPYYNQFLDRILCMCQYLFKVQQQNRLEQKGLLKRFSIICSGHQESVEEMRADKAMKYKELKNNPSKIKEYEEYFLNYQPENNRKKGRIKEISRKKRGTKKRKNKENKKKGKGKTKRFWVI